MPTMPNVLGLELRAAELSLQQAGVLNLASLGYFGTWPITAKWVKSASPPSTVTAQSPSSGSQIAANAAVTLTMAEFPTGVVYP